MVRDADASAEYHEYLGSGHLYTDASLPEECSPANTELLWTESCSSAPTWMTPIHTRLDHTEQHATTTKWEAGEHDTDPELTGEPWTTRQSDSS